MRRIQSPRRSPLGENNENVAWDCQNFYVPRYDAEKKRYQFEWYGFAQDEKAESLLQLFQSLLPHPKL
jgi:hypothetical protein